MKQLLRINNLTVAIEEQTVLHGLDLSIASSQVHALMGPNGSGKSTLAYALMGHPRYSVQNGEIFLNDTAITHLTPDKRAKLGLFLSFQHPQEIAGVQVFTFLKEAKRALSGTDVAIEELFEELSGYCQLLQIDQTFLYRNLNDGFSGGEKKKFEMLQLLVLKPKIAILDEIDSGLDVDALKAVAAGIAHARTTNPALAILLITHYQRILHYIKPDQVHVLMNGKLTESGDYQLAERIETSGYQNNAAV
jgi:Fe-S cluster assembly ATP-binding protein